MHTTLRMGTRARITIRFAVIIGLLVAGPPVFSQSPFDSGDTKGSVLLGQGGFIQFEASKDSITLGYQGESLTRAQQILDQQPNTRIHNIPRYGFSLQAKPNDNTASLFQSHDLSVGGEVIGNLGQSNLASYHRSTQQSTGRRGQAIDVLIGKKPLLPLQAYLDALDEAEKALINAKQETQEAGTLYDNASNKVRTPSETEALRVTLERKLADQDARVKILVTAVKNYVSNKQLIQEFFPEHDARDTIDAAFPKQKARLETEFPELKTQIDVAGPKEDDPTPPDQNHTLSTEDQDILKVVLDLGKSNMSEGKKAPFTDRQIAVIKRHLESQGPGDMTFDQLDVRLGVSRSANTLLNPQTTTFAAQVAKRQFTGWSALLSYSAEYGRLEQGPGIQRLFGFAVGVERRNNASDLKQIDLRDIVFTSQDGTTSRTGETSRKVLQGDYKESTALVANTDFVFLPPSFDNRLAVDLFTRTTRDNSTDFRPGMGVFLVQKGAPRKVLGGVSVSRTMGGKAQVDLIAGFNF